MTTKAKCVTVNLFERFGNYRYPREWEFNLYPDSSLTTPYIVEKNEKILVWRLKPISSIVKNQEKGIV